MFHRDDFPAACLWPLAADGYRLKGDWIEPAGLDDWFPSAPLADTELFSSFVRLGARGQPSANQCLRWVRKHGLLKRRDKEHGPVIVKLLPAPPGAYPAEWWLVGQDVLAKDTRTDNTVERRSLNQAPISLDDFRAEVGEARGALKLYEALRENRGEKGSASGLKLLVEAAREQKSHVVLTGVDEGLARIGDEVLETPWTDTPAFCAALILEGFVKQKVSSVRLGFFGFTDRLAHGPLYAPVQSWICPDLLSAVYLQFYLWMVKAWPMRICANPPCSTPFPATRTDKLYCIDACRSAARDRP